MIANYRENISVAEGIETVCDTKLFKNPENQNENKSKILMQFDRICQDPVALL